MSDLNPRQWTEVRQLFERATELSREQRGRFLERECQDDDVRAEVASLLEHSGPGLLTAGHAIASVATAVALEQDPDQWLIGARLGAYRVEAIIGHGGMGAVYRAERDDAEFYQRVAIKLVRTAASSPTTLLRFKQERQILARLSHPHIARLLDGGSTPGGVPYLVMEFIEGEPITTWCERHALKVEERLRLFMRVCEAVEHAHRSLIVHRDLKPANILVTLDGTPKLLDFGIAKLLDGNASAEAFTGTGLHLMTPDYASPEQVRCEPVSPATDVYALGLILYELLTGQKAQKISDYTPATIAQVVCQTQAPAPAALRPQLWGDLDNIIRMAIRKEPERRYRSAGELARDLERHLDGQPVVARPDTLAYRGAKFVTRNRMAVLAGLVIWASVVAGVVASLSARRDAEKRVPRVQQVRQLTMTGRVEIVAGVITDGKQVFFTEHKGGQWTLARVSVDGGTPQPLQLSRELRRPHILDISHDRSNLLVVADGEDPRELPERRIWMVPITGGAPHRVGDSLGHSGAWLRDGSVVLARGSELYRVNADGSGYRKLIDLPGRGAGLIRAAPPSGPDVLRFCLANFAMKPVNLWEMTPDGKNLHPLLRGWHSGTGYPEGERDGVWVASGKYYLFHSRRGRVSRIWALREGHDFLFPDRAPVQIYSTPMDFVALGATPDGKRVYIGAGQERRELMRYDQKLRQFLPLLPGVSGQWVSYSNDGRWVAYVTSPERSLWRSRSDGSEVLQLTPQSIIVTSAPHWSPDGTRIAFCGAPRGSPPSAYVIPATGGEMEMVNSASFLEGGPSWSPDGKSLLYGRALPGKGRPQSGIFVMDWTTRNSKLLPGSDHMRQPIWSGNGNRIVAQKGLGQLALFEFRTQRWTTLATGGGLWPAYSSKDGRYVFYQDYLGGEEQPIYRVEVAGRKVERLLGLKQIPQSNVSGYLFGGMAPDGAPIVSVIRSNSDIYSLDLELP